jgi:uncharacterized protein YdhG (YjbR/CyaY superfamily)
MPTPVKTVETYLAAIPEERRQALTVLRKLIRRIAPKAKESIQYGMPAYQVGDVVIGLASQKQYMAFYCCDDVIETYRPRFRHLDCGKGCIRFKRLDDLPLDAVEALLRDVVKRSPQG